MSSVSYELSLTITELKTGHIIYSMFHVVDVAGRDKVHRVQVCHSSGYFCCLCDFVIAAAPVFLGVIASVKVKLVLSEPLLLRRQGYISLYSPGPPAGQYTVVVFLDVPLFVTLVIPSLLMVMVT